MITTTNAVKTFGPITALSGIHSSIPDGCIYGLVGSNGAGKSTFIRLLAGIYRPDTGTVYMDGSPIYDNPAAKGQIAIVPDELFFLPGASIRRMADLYAPAYSGFNWKLLETLCETFSLSPSKPLHTFSKGMRRQAAFVLALSCQTKYLLLDETFDGLDPILRDLAKRLIYDAVCQHGVTVVLTSHSLRELEDTCDQLALLHKGGLVLQSDVDNLKTTLCKVQVAFPEAYDQPRFDALGLNILRYSQHGSVASFILRGDRDEALAKLSGMRPILCEALPLSLEEIFVHEMEVLGYAFDDSMEPIMKSAPQKEAIQ